MNDLKVVTTCPLGHSCEKVVDSHIERCAWYVRIAGKDPQSGKDIEESKCSMAWQPILMIEANGLTIGTNASIQSMRNESLKRQDAALGVLNAKISSDK